RDWFSLFQENDRNGPIGAFAMSELSEMLLRRCFDYDAIAQRRRDNYAALQSSLAHLSLLGGLPPEVVPLGFPIRTSRRDELRQHLFDEQIYPPVHWRIKGVVPEAFVESHQLSDEIMTLPCDQRYGADDMHRMAS